MFQTGDRVRHFGDQVTATVTVGGGDRMRIRWDDDPEREHYVGTADFTLVSAVESAQSVGQDTLLAWSMDAGLLGGTLSAVRDELDAAVSDMRAAFDVAARHRVERAIATIDGALARTERYGKS